MGYNFTGQDVIVAVQNVSYVRPSSTEALTWSYSNFVRALYMDILDRTLTKQQQSVQSVSIVAQSEHRVLAHIIANDTASRLNGISLLLVTRPFHPVVQLVLLGSGQSEDDVVQEQKQQQQHRFAFWRLLLRSISKAIVPVASDSPSFSTMVQYFLEYFPIKIHGYHMMCPLHSQGAVLDCRDYPAAFLSMAINVPAEVKPFSPVLCPSKDLLSVCQHY